MNTRIHRYKNILNSHTLNSFSLNSLMLFSIRSNRLRLFNIWSNSVHDYLAHEIRGRFWAKNGRLVYHFALQSLLSKLYFRGYSQDCGYNPGCPPPKVTCRLRERSGAMKSLFADGKIVTGIPSNRVTGIPSNRVTKVTQLIEPEYQGGCKPKFLSKSIQGFLVTLTEVCEWK